MRKVKIVTLVAMCASITVLNFVSSVSAESKNAIALTRLHFISSLDANMYTKRIVYELFNRLGIDILITHTEMSRGAKGVEAGIYDGICNQSEEVEVLYKNMIAVPVTTATVKYSAVTLLEDAPSYNSWDSLKGKRVGSLAGKPNLTGKLPSGIAAHVEKSSMGMLYNSLRNGECDVVIIIDTSAKDYDQLVLPGDLKVAGLLSSAPCHIYLNRQYAGLIEQITKELHNMEQDGTLAQIKAMKPAGNRNEKSVLYLSSYSSEMEWEQRLMEGIGNVLNLHKDIVFHNVALNSFRNTNAALLEGTALRAISADFMHSPPDAVIVSDNEAMGFLLNNYNTILPNDIPIVACGLNGKALFSSHWFDRYPNMVGMLEEISAAQTVEAMLKLFPSAKRIFVINDYSLTGQRWKNEIQKQLGTFQGRIQIDYNENLSFDDLMGKVATFDEHTLILCGSYFLDRDNHYFPQATIQGHLYNAAHVPIFGLLDSTQPYGPLGGRYINAVLHGETAANSVVEILRTGHAGKVSYIDTEKDNRWIFNWNIMRRYSINNNQLPEGTIILNKQLSLRETNPVLFYTIIVGAISCAVIITLLAFFARALKKRNDKLVLAEISIRKSHDEIAGVKNRLQTILETAPIAYSLLVDDIVIESNSYYRENIGLKPGQKNASKYGENSRYTDLMEECLENGFVGNIYWHITTVSGKRVRYFYNIARSEYEGRQAIVMWGIEIEQLELQKDALNRAYLDLEELIESTPLPIALVDPEKKYFINTNPSWRYLFNIPESLSISNLKWGDDGIFTLCPMDDLFQKAMDTGDIISQEWVFSTYDGMPFEALVHLKKVIFGGRDCLVVTHQDLREERARERMLQNAAEKEREANRLKSHFLMNMSHEIKTPMNAIIGITQLAKPTDEPKKLFDSVTQIGHSASVLLNIINDILDLSLIQEGKLKVAPEEAKLSQIIAALDAVIAVEMDKKRIIHKTNMEEIVHNTIFVDSSRLQQIIIALTSNAVKFTPEGGEISLTVTETEESNDISTFLFTVNDTGIGIEAEKMDRLFKPFEQGDDSITRQYGGAGLGLSIVKNIVELMDGDIWVESEVGKGSTFFFTIRVPVILEQVEIPAPSCGSETAFGEDAAKMKVGFSKLRVLLVDDVEINRIIASELLGELGIAVEEAENGRRAVDMFSKAPPGYYDLIFMDVQMPLLDGCTATKEIRAHARPDAATLPIVAMTANVMPDDIKMVMEAGMNGYIGKPIFVEKLIETIEALVAPL